MTDDRGAANSRVTDYDTIADRFDARYGLYSYAGVREALLGFVADAPSVLEVGCGTGHWLATMLHAAGGAQHRVLAGMDPAAAVLARARDAAPGAHLVRARAEDLPWR